MEGMRERCLLVVHIDCGVALIWFAVAPTMLKYTIPSIVTFLKIWGELFLQDRSLGVFRLASK
jgi:hypothetical protein